MLKIYLSRISDKYYLYFIYSSENYRKLQTTQLGSDFYSLELFFHNHLQRWINP